MATRIPLDESLWAEYLSGQESQLPVLPPITRLSPRVIRILAGNPGTMQLQGTNTYLVGTGRERVLIDTGEGHPIWLTHLQTVLAQEDISISHVLLTHWHGDHTGGVPSLLSTFPYLQAENRVFKAHPDKNPNPSNSSSYIQSPITHNDLFTVDGATLRAIYTPGHATDHMCFVLQEESALFTGDNVLGHGVSVVQDLAVYMGSLETMQGLHCGAGYPGHGEWIGDVQMRIGEYIRGFEVRVRRVVEVLARPDGEEFGGGKRAGGGMTLPEIVRGIYGDVPRDLVDNAIVPFLSQVLWKLAEDRRVGFELGGSNRRRWFGLCVEG
ncbi:beta-lactamase-like protein [Aspergillus undulatus]|uniref:beta-lactamase-like protein n=1 Tax=Aspergillus undulatus TaxID=1810928 RepID=UPI003CCD80FA